MLNKYKSDIIFFGFLAIVVVVSYFLAESVFPFIIGLSMAFLFNPSVKRIQKLIKNRTLAVTVFLVSTIIIGFGTIYIFASHISTDFSRLNTAFRTYATNNSEQLDNSAKTVTSYIEKFYSPEDLKQQLGIDINADSLSFEELSKNVNSDDIFNGLDTDAIKESLSSITSIFSSDDEQKPQGRNLNWFIIILSSMGYFLYIIYDIGYFEDKFKKYFGGKSNKMLESVITDFKRTFLVYFGQRGKIVLIFTVIFTTSFFIIGIPGALLLGFLAGLLCFVSYLQYLALIPIAISCLILSMEQGNNFFIYFGIVLAIFILASILEELVLFPKIMKGVSGMNPVIMMLSLSVWSYMLGPIGLLIALPISSLILSYANQILLYGKDDVKTLEA